MKVENMTSSNGNKIANQFIIKGLNSPIIFQSYDSTVAELTHDNYLIIHGSVWDYSNTTRKYFKQFINEQTPFHYETKKQWIKLMEEDSKIRIRVV